MVSMKMPKHSCQLFAMTITVWKHQISPTVLKKHKNVSQRKFLTANIQITLVKYRFSFPKINPEIPLKQRFHQLLVTPYPVLCFNSVGTVKVGAVQIASCGDNRICITENTDCFFVFNITVSSVVALNSVNYRNIRYFIGICYVISVTERVSVSNKSADWVDLFCPYIQIGISQKRTW